MHSKLPLSGALNLNVVPVKDRSMHFCGEPVIAAMHSPHSFSILVTVPLYTLMPEVCHWLTNEKQRKTDIRLTDQ